MHPTRVWMLNRQISKHFIFSNYNCRVSRPTIITHGAGWNVPHKPNCFCCKLVLRWLGCLTLQHYLLVHKLVRFILLPRSCNALWYTKHLDTNVIDSRCLWLTVLSIVSMYLNMHNWLCNLINYCHV